METFRTDELARVLERVVGIGLRGGWKGVDLNFPWPGVDVRDSLGAESTSSFPSRTRISASGVMGFLPNLSASFKVKDPDPAVETLDRKEVPEKKQP
jgi:hypothetical protein